MKKIYLSVLALAAASAVNAQVNTTTEAHKFSSFEGKTKKTGVASEKVTLWTNDFGTASDWTFANTSSPALDWNIEMDPTVIPVAALAPASFTSVANGFGFINSDGAGDGATQDAYLTYTGTIDCSTEPNVSIQFEHSYRQWNDTRTIEVSNDGGATWTVYNVTEGGVTQNSQNFDEVYSVDISAAAGGQASVSLRFHYVGAYGWYWAVDDIVVQSTEPYDLKAETLQWGVVGSWGPRLPYYNTPVDQIQPIEFCGSATNIGVNDVNDFTLAVDINGGAWTGTSAGTDVLAAGALDTICAATTYTPAGAGSNAVTAAVSTPANAETALANNAYAATTFDVVTNGVYARDNVAAGIVGGTFNQGNGFESGNVFDIFVADNIYGVEVAVSPNAVEGAQMYAKLYTIDPNDGSFINVDQSDYYTITAADLGASVQLPFLTAVAGGTALNAGETYLVTVGSDGDGGLSNDLVIGTSGDSEAQTTFYFDATDQTWYFSTATPAVRMVFDESLAINEVENVFGMNVYPNPANEATSVSFELNNAADVAVTVTDLSGKVVYTNNLGNVAAGTANVNINTAALTEGVYMVNVAANGAVSTEKLVVKK